MSPLDKNDPNLSTLLAVISTKLDNVIEMVKKLEDNLEKKVDIGTFETKLDSHEKYLKNLEDRIVEERKHREGIKEEIAFSKGQAKVHGGIWGLIGSVVVGVITHFFTK